MLRRVLMVFIFLTSTLYTTEYALVMNKKVDIKKLSLKQVRDIFMMKRHFIANVKIIPVNLSSSLPARVDFEKQVLKIDREKINHYWIKQHFQGIRPPLVQSSLKSMKLFIKNVDGAIGYMPIENVDDDLRITCEF